MKHLTILGAGTAGTIVANRMRRDLGRDWQVTVIDPAPDHLYQPGLLFLPFGARDEAKMVRRRASTLADGVRWVDRAVDAVDIQKRQVALVGGETLPYDYLVLATGAAIQPQETPGLLGPAWRKTIHDFYTLEGARALRQALEGFRGGRLVLNVVDNPIKCPVAPLEFLFLADEFFTRKGRRGDVELVYATPLEGAFTKPVASKVLGSLLEEKGIHVEPEFMAAEVDAEAKVLRSFDEREVPFDLLVTIPLHMGAEFLGRCGLGNDVNFVPTDRHTLQVKGQERLFALGDTTDLPSSKAGSVAHFQSEVLAENLHRAIAGRALVPNFDGHANCFVESGFGRAILIDFNYETEPLPGRFPLPVVGPMTLLEESRRNHWGKLGLRFVYWNALLPARPLPLPHRMSMRGKRPASDILQAA
ncbi:MAG TPA: FAD/NAD(P)-binding oxidoreductase [Thermoanaerobaculia bacterium]|nr:FAD/NAD(P)-binding oxidoreductase [Thermoanaerobaculia bacterium]